MINKLNPIRDITNVDFWQLHGLSDTRANHLKSDALMDLSYEIDTLLWERAELTGWCAREFDCYHWYAQMYWDGMTASDIVDAYLAYRSAK